MDLSQYIRKLRQWYTVQNFIIRDKIQILVKIQIVVSHLGKK